MFHTEVWYHCYTCYNSNGFIWALVSYYKVKENKLLLFLEYIYKKALLIEAIGFLMQLLFSHRISTKTGTKAESAVATDCSLDYIEVVYPV